MRKLHSTSKEWVSLADRAYASIRDGIMTGTYSIGSALSRRKLGAELGMSSLPISEALQRLEAEGLVQNKPRVGTIIRVPSPQEVRGLFVVREALECQSARLFSEKASPGEKQHVFQLAVELDNCLVNGTSSQQQVLSYRKRHMSLHMAIAEASGCESLARAIEKNQVLVFTSIYDSFLGAEAQPPTSWHQRLLECLIGTDVEKSESAMRAHVRYGLESLLIRLEPFLQWDESKLTALIEQRACMAGSDEAHAGHGPAR
jgi:DNA-binding GntR family transcriptional regulator